MIGALTLLLPVGLALYFLYRALKQPIFLLGIPFLQVMARSVFFWEVRPFRMPVAVRGYRKMTLWTHSVLTAARHIYQQAGFELVATDAHEEFGKKLIGETWDLRL